jgi:small subunit ribosomal protein S17
MGEKRVIQGIVISDKMDKTIVVRVERRKKHRLYLNLTKHYKAHDEDNRSRMGDEVRIVESKPFSKEKRFRLIEILSKGDVAEIRPETIGREWETATQVAPKREEVVATELEGESPAESEAEEESKE